MLKAYFFISLALFCTGCASSTSKPSAPLQTSKMSSTTKAIKYVSNTGCHVLNNGYMVCAKSH
jgi:hypothetical protein